MLTTEPISALIGALAMAVIGGVGFLLRRWITGEHRREQLAELTGLASVAAAMKAGSVSLEELHTLRRYLRSPGTPAPEPSSAAAAVLNAEKKEAPDEGPVTQGEMNEAAAEALKGAEAEMRDVLAELAEVLSPDELRELNEAQRKWDEFAIAHANFVSRLFEGGSMRPLWWITTIDRATRERISELRSYLEARRW